MPTPALSCGSARALRVGDKLVEQELVYEKLPADIAERHVLLLDPILATGNSAARAIQARYQLPSAAACPHDSQLMRKTIQALEHGMQT